MKTIARSKVEKYVKGKGKISIPELQNKFKLDYKEASNLKDCLVNDGTICEEPEGIYYSLYESAVPTWTMKKNFAREMIGYIKDPWIHPLSLLQKKRVVSREELSASVTFERFAQRTIDEFLKYNLICEMNGKYYLLLDARSVDAFIKLCRAALRNSWTSLIDSPGAKERDTFIDNLFDFSEPDDEDDEDDDPDGDLDDFDD